MITSEINKLVKCPVLSPGSVTGLSSFMYVLLIDGATPSIPVNVSFTEVGHGVYSLSFTPTTTGVYDIFVDNKNQYQVEVVDQKLGDVINNVLSFVSGSWTWNKITGELELFDTNGNFLQAYTMTDTANEAKRELR